MITSGEAKSTDGSRLPCRATFSPTRRRIGEKVALQGNLDPSVLFASPEVITSEVEKILASYGQGSGHVFNLGHGISQFTPPENAAALVEAVHTSSRKFHSVRT